MSLKRKGDDVFTDVSFGEVNNQQQFPLGASQNVAVVVVPSVSSMTKSSPFVTMGETDEYNVDDNDENNPHIPAATMKQLSTQLKSLRTDCLQSQDPLFDEILETTAFYSKSTFMEDQENASNAAVAPAPVPPSSASVDDTYDEDAIEQLLKESKSIRGQLSRQLQQAKEECSHESERLSSMASQLAEMKEQRQSLAQRMQDLERRQIDLQTQIASHQEEAAEEIELIDTVEEERKRQVPRLKGQLSLYASTTGIKWDFDEAAPTTDNGEQPSKLLSGQVAIPSQESVKLFSIDPEEKSPFEVANHLWDLMEGTNPNCP